MIFAPSWVYSEEKKDVQIQRNNGNHIMNLAKFIATSPRVDFFFLSKTPRVFC